MTIAVETLDRGISAETASAAPGIRALTMEELEWVAGGDRGDAAVGGAAAGAAAGGAAGWWTGARIGARVGGLIGELLGPAGAVAGFVIGGLLGAAAGAWIYDEYATDPQTSRAVQGNG